MEAVEIGIASLDACRYSSGVSAAVVAAGESIAVAAAVVVVVVVVAVETAGPALGPGDRLE